MAQTSNTPWRALLRIQQVVSIAILVGAFAFPGYILYRHGLSVLPVYDRYGNVIGQANYFFVSIGMSIFAVAIGWICFKSARRALQQLGEPK